MKALVICSTDRMTPTAALLDVAAAPTDADNRPLDARGLQDMVERGGAEGAMDPTGRRGPFRPEVWMNARQRSAVRLAAHYFRAIDVAAVISLTLLCAGALAPAGLARATLAEAVPFATGAAILLGLVRSLDLYGFPSGRAPMLHLAALAGVAGVATAASVLVGALMTGGWSGVPAILVWGGLALVTLYGLHLVWLERVAAWRRSGALTPNVVVVGATRHAEGLIRAALKRRDVNVLGVFDDRAARSPETVQGVPVLGDSEALLTHRILPFVDRVVVAIDPKAEARVRHLMSRLGVLPNQVTLLVDPVRAEDRAEALARLADSRLAPLSGRRDDDRRAFNKRLQDLIVGGIALIVLERWSDAGTMGLRRVVRDGVETLEQRDLAEDSMKLSWKTALGIGLWQCLSIIPGVSRSGATIVGGLLLGVDKKAAAEFSFFLAIPTMVGAFALDFWESREMITNDVAGLIGIGFVVSFISGLFVVRFLVDFVGRFGFAPFSAWRILVGTVGLLAIWLY